MTTADVQRIAAFSDGNEGGNPAGVWIGAAHPPEAEMQRIAHEIGYSETAFAAPLEEGGVEGYRVRYFSPEAEVPFCGHATIALGAALAASRGDGVFPLTLNGARITVEGRRGGGEGAQLVSAALQDRKS
ncbi:MAG TPA: PhzF family phenazine biosynthesis protein, partial [Massilia sp.]|nr:PhzF family phenazine biosynthesis protein [Massilia sp.]